jgi:hypothetical protein
MTMLQNKLVAIQNCSLEKINISWNEFPKIAYNKQIILTRLLASPVNPCKPLWLSPQNQILQNQNPLKDSCLFSSVSSPAHRET